MTNQHLTDEQLSLLGKWDDLSRKDRKAITQLLDHLLKISLDRRARRDWMNAHGATDVLRPQAAA